MKSFWGCVFYCTIILILLIDMSKKSVIER